MENLKEKYGLYTAIALVVGVVIGSGVFFKADDVLVLTEGNLILALLAWVLGAFSMIFGALVFAEFAHRIKRANGIVDYTEVAYGKAIGYLVGWFKGVLYFSPLSAILSYAASLYTLILFGSENPANSSATWIIAFCYLIMAYVLNYWAPVISGRFQVATTVIKLIPLGLVAVVGVSSGMINGITMNNFSLAAGSIGESGGSYASAVVATAFAYEGWIVALTINGEIKDSKRNLPKALTVGSLIVFLVYVLYFLGMASVLPTDQIVAQGDNAVKIASTQLFGNLAASILTGFVIISCLGTLNGLALSNSRIPFTLAIRNQGPFPKLMRKINSKTNMPLNSFIFSGLLAFGYLMLWYASINRTFGMYIGLDEIPIVLIYGIYIFLYIWYIRNYKDLSIWSRFVKPICAIAGALVILYGGITNPNIGIYLLVSIGILLLGLLFYRREIEFNE